VNQMSPLKRKEEKKKKHKKKKNKKKHKKEKKTGKKKKENRKKTGAPTVPGYLEARGGEAGENHVPTPKRPRKLAKENLQQSPVVP